MRIALLPSHTQDTPNEDQSAGVLSGWATSGINLEFVLFQNLTVNDPTNGSWVFVCKQFATIRGGSTAAPPINDATALWTWGHGSAGAGASFNWTKADELPRESGNTVPRTTRNIGSRPFANTSSNIKVDFWNVQKTANGTKDEWV